MRFQQRFLMAVTLLLISGAVGCSTRPDDAAIVSQVQSRIAADSSLAGKAIHVQSSEGMVTLAGTVDHEQQRAAAAMHAGTVAGVKTVVNNLQVGVASAAIPEAAEAAPPASATATTTPAAPTKPKPRTSTPSPAAGVANPAAVSAPPSPVVPVPVTIPEGTVLAVRTIDAIDSEKNKIGDVFQGTLENPIVIDGKMVAAKGADVEGRVVAAKGGGKFAGRPEISLELTKLTVGGKSYPLKTSEFATHGASRGKETAVAVGGGAAVGAIIGGIAGGGKGAAIGAAAGAGAGTGVQAIRKSGQVKVPPESVLDFQLLNPVSVTPVDAAKTPTP